MAPGSTPSLPPFIVNPKTRKIHIAGLCKHVSPAERYQRFRTEAEAAEAFAGDLSHCKVCWRHRDKG